MRFSVFKRVLNGLINFLLLSSLFGFVNDKSFAKESISIEKKEIETNKNNYANNYILAPGDSLLILFQNVVEFSDIYSIQADGKIFLPEIGFIKVNGYTIEDLQKKLTSEYEKYIFNPDLNISIANYRPVKVFVAGEVKTPGFYVLSGTIQVAQSNLINRSENPSNKSENLISNSKIINQKIINVSNPFSNLLFPTIYDALQASKGITPYSDLSRIEVVRNFPESKGGGKIITEISLISLLKEGDQTQNIRIFDGDSIKVSKSNLLVNEQILEMRRTNLNPEFITVFVGGDVKNPGKIILPQGSGLNQAIASAGGLNLLNGKIEFLRFDREGNLDDKYFSYKRSAKIDTNQNPGLMDGDIINVRKSILKSTSEGLGIITQPFVQSFTLYKLFN